ncbi:alkene reductase [Paenibacillus polymyxa]|uniref:Alkene reductase n=1 Tax=Paenibacillus polymyxa TaxID=1406 RepID=A0A8I1LRD0_PAEPO|nr:MULTISPECIES: alkene reductase [Paenibacillus]KAF6574817.1 alkene reductase [Paenibacillus sp. EKM206P]KAF6590510.1 alkene reductase [Paenibacillus sp. EKM205P]MBM0634060.1 alkene reductase [Paenibacillus polymyxa]
MKKLWSKTKIGKMELPHRLAMTPMTRSRSQEDGTPGELTPLYYAQRASMGLIITEGTQPSDDGQGYLWTPGIYTDKHIEGWKKVTDAVHEAGGYMYIQLMHAGRMSHPDNTPHHRQPVAPSAIAPGVEMFTAKGMQEIPVPRELSVEDIQTTIADFRKAAAAAIKAGADGVEIHGANGYLINQFIGENSNTRTDQYGGSIENRARFAIELTKAIVEEIGAEATGFRISPGTPLGGIQDGEQGPELYRYLVKELAQLDLAYLHVMHLGNEKLLQDIRSIWTNPLLVNRAGRALEDLSTDLDSGLADMVPVGVWSLANPDLVERLQKGAPLNEADPTTFFGLGSKGYTDYPTIRELESQEGLQ